jgi:hypothetical protein
VETQGAYFEVGLGNVFPAHSRILFGQASYFRLYYNQGLTEFHLSDKKKEEEEEEISPCERRLTKARRKQDG